MNKTVTVNIGGIVFHIDENAYERFKKYLEYKNGFMYQMIRSNIERGVKEGVYRDDIDVDIMTRYRIYSIMLSFNTLVFPNNRSNVVYIEQQLLEHFLNGLATSKGHKLNRKFITVLCCCCHHSKKTN